MNRTQKNSKQEHRSHLKDHLGSHKRWVPRRVQQGQWLDLSSSLGDFSKQTQKGKKLKPLNLFKDLLELEEDISSTPSACQGGCCRKGFFKSGSCRNCSIRKCFICEKPVRTASAACARCRQTQQYQEEWGKQWKMKERKAC